MSARLAHRGPDDRGLWAEATSGVAFGFQRLAIIDVSDQGHQPMRSPSGQYTLVFNGEVYNYRALRSLLENEGFHFSGESDTEVICAAFERWGIRSAVTRFIGMFAIAVWDAATKQLTLVRDRLGIKPLYYYHRPGILTFGSELKALVAGPDFDKTLDEDALAAYLRFLYVPAPQTIYRYARKLLPGHTLSVKGVGASIPESSPYWTLSDVYTDAQRCRFDGSDSEAIEALTTLISDSVTLRMRADVPLGALLSGGIDSSTVVAMMQANASRPTRTFSIAFPGTEHDESRHAARIAKRLGTDHTEMSVTGPDALAVVPHLPTLFDEPLADPSQIPTYLVCKLARRDVTVALSGDGGDELFGGYERYIQGERLIRAFRGVPAFARRAAGMAIGTVSVESWDRAHRGLTRLAPGLRNTRLAGSKMRKFGEMLRQDSEDSMYRSLLSAWQNSKSLLAPMESASDRIETRLSRTAGLPLRDRMMLLDQETYLPDDLLAKVDRASMAVSLEARVPLLDHRIVEFAWRLGPGHKVRNGQGKWLLRQVLYQFLEPELVDRPKVGFSVPLAAWLRGPLRSWADDIFNDPKGMDSPILLHRVAPFWKRFQEGDDQPSLALWTVLMFESWRNEWL